VPAPSNSRDVTSEFTADFTGDVTGDTTDGNWLLDSLSDPSSAGKLLDISGSENGRALASARHSIEPDDDSASWERSVIGDHDHTGPVAERTRSTPPTSSVPPSSETSPSTSPKPTKAAKPPKPAKPAKPANTRPTRSQRRTYRRQDKRLAEREAKALMHRRPLWRGRIVPKTVLGISFTMLTTGLAMAVSGTLLFMNYRFRQDQSDTLVRNFPSQVRQAQRAVTNEGRNARSQIQAELEPLKKLAATAETLTTVLNGAEPSVWAIRTFDVDGQGTAGTAFVVASDDEKTFMLTSLDVVQASTVKPGPKILVRKGGKEEEATLFTWDEERDLALLVVSTLGNQPPLSWASPDATKLGDQVFDVSGFGANDASIVEGRVADLWADGIQHTAPIGTHFRGGPIIDGDGRVVAISSRTYAPLGFTSDGVYFAPPIQSACTKVLRCLNNRVDGAGTQR
jgi:S1-C subfamily serine protease